MKVVAVDTNIILAFQLKRQPALKVANQIFRDCLDGKIQIYIPEVVFAEDEWVLRSFYKKPKDLILTFLEELLKIENVILQNKRKVLKAVSLFKLNNLGFADCLILAEVEEFDPDEFITSDLQMQKVYTRLI